MDSILTLPATLPGLFPRDVGGPWGAPLAGAPVAEGRRPALATETTFAPERSRSAGKERAELEEEAKMKERLGTAAPSDAGEQSAVPRPERAGNAGVPRRGT